MPKSESTDSQKLDGFCRVGSHTLSADAVNYAKNAYFSGLFGSGQSFQADFAGVQPAIGSGGLGLARLMLYLVLL